MTSGKRSVTEGVALASWGALAGIDRRVTQARETEAQRRSCHQSADEHPSTDIEATRNNIQRARIVAEAGSTGIRCATDVRINREGVS